MFLKNGGGLYGRVGRSEEEEETSCESSKCTLQECLAASAAPYSSVVGIR